MEINTDNGFTLEETKEMQINHLKAVRDNKEMEPVVYNGNRFDFDQKSYERITAAIYALDLSGGTIHWTTADNETIEVSANDLRGVIAAAAVRSNTLHTTYRTLKDRVMAAKTNEEVLEIQWPED